jgi:hypothetical protein
MPYILFDAFGSGSWLKPAGVRRVEIECWGAGGNGGTRTAVGQLTGGGGGGAYSANMSGLTTNYTEGELLVPYYIPTPGSQIDTTWGRNSSAPEWNVYNRVRAKSGTNGGINFSGAGGTNAGDGTTLYSGGNGALGIDSTNFGGGGGGAAGELGNGGNASGLSPGSGNGIYSGTGGRRGVSAPTPYGAGGNGGGPGASGTGGLIRIYYEYPAVTYFEIGSDFRAGASIAHINPTDGANIFRKL